jgi:hypothetical protein
VLAGRSLWDELTPLLSSYNKTITAAIAYVGSGGASLCRSEKAPRSSWILLEWAKAGVRVHSLPNLHAKMILAESPDDAHDPFVVVGSANASAASAHRLHESLVLLDGAECVDEARAALLKWKSQSGAALTVTRLRELAEQFGIDRPESDGDDDESESETGSDEGDIVPWPLPTSLYIAPVGGLDEVSAESLHKRDELAEEFGCGDTNGDSEFRIDMFWWDEPDGYEYEPNWRYADGSTSFWSRRARAVGWCTLTPTLSPRRRDGITTCTPSLRSMGIHTVSSFLHLRSSVRSRTSPQGTLRKVVLAALLSIWPDITYNES